LSFLLQASPTARRLLGAQSRDLLAPLWTQLAQALRNTPFDIREPTLHRSFALTQAHDWAGAADSVLSEPDWQQHPTLCLRLVESAFQRRQRVAALAAWCQVCWRAPEEAARAVSRLRQPELTALWQRFLDHETLTESDFPAWLLMSEPGLALQLAEDLATGTPAEDAYRCVHRWVHARRARKHDEELSLRKTLQSLHPELLNLLKRSV